MFVGQYVEWVRSYVNENPMRFGWSSTAGPVAELLFLRPPAASLRIRVADGTFNSFIRLANRHISSHRSSYSTCPSPCVLLPSRSLATLSRAWLMIALEPASSLSLIDPLGGAGEPPPPRVRLFHRQATAGVHLHTSSTRMVQRPRPLAHKPPRRGQIRPPFGQYVPWSTSPTTIAAKPHSASNTQSPAPQRYPRAR